MGADAEVYIFDDSAFRERVCPALRRFADTGKCEGWLEDLLKHLEPEVWEFAYSRIRGLGFSFDAVCHYLDRTFAFPSADTCYWSDYWEYRACPSASCPASGACPLHASRQPPAAEDFNFLFNACVIDQCLGRGQFVGRSVNAGWYDAVMAASALGPQHPAAALLRRLGLRGYVVGYTFSNSDGVHGWLHRDETRDLYGYLSNLDLPWFAASFEAMAGFRPHGPEAMWSYEPPAPYSFKQLSLAFVRTMAEVAMSEGKGLLWGNDLSTYWKAGRGSSR